MLFGAWPRFSRSPQPWHDQLCARFDLLDRDAWDGMAAQKFAYRVGEVEAKLLARAAADLAGTLGIRRGALAFYYEVIAGCDDSYGGVGDVIFEAVGEYVVADRTDSGIDAEVFWRDFLGWAVLAGSYGLLHNDEIRLLRKAGVRAELDLVEGVLVDLAGQFAAARMGWHSGQAQELRAEAVVAAGAVSRFVAVAEDRGSGSWAGLEAMVGAAMRSRRPELAIGGAGRCRRPGRYQDRARSRRADLTGADLTYAGRRARRQGRGRWRSGPRRGRDRLR